LKPLFFAVFAVPAVVRTAVFRIKERLMKTYSLRWRILVGVLLAVTVAWITVGIIAYREARHEAEALLDAHLAQSATLLFTFLGDEAHDLDAHLPRHRYDNKVAFQIWEGESVLLTHSAGAPATRLSMTSEGFSDVEVEGKSWRVFSTWDPKHHHLVQVADAMRSRDHVSDEVAWHLLIPLLFGLPLLGLALGAFVVVAFRPLEQLADSIAAQAPERLQPIALSTAPREITPILERLNLLFERVTRTQEEERRFTADAAHELRTPLAVMQTHAEVASAAIDEATRRHALDNLVSGSRRAARLLDQLLTLARLDAQSALPGSAPCDLHALLIETVALLVPAAIQKGVEVEVEELEGVQEVEKITGNANDDSQKIMLAGSPLLLQVLIRNLVDNAIRYTPPGGSVQIGLQRAVAGRVCLHVSDSGPGIPAEKRSEVLARFRRLDESGEEGHGLGLSIVARIAALHDAKFRLESAPILGGLAAWVDFPVIT
jgi:two-component system sensor histidine kinase QseC